MTALRALALFLVLAYWLANALLHLAFSNWIVSGHDTFLGPVVPLNYATDAALISALLVAIPVLWRAVRAQRRWQTATLWLLWLVTLVACDRWLLTTRVESIHYLQYGIISVLLAWALDPVRRTRPLLEILLVSLLLSIADELYQYLHLTARQGSYFDFNDLLLNQLGALGGLLFYYGFTESPTGHAQGLPRLRRGLLGVFLCLALVSLGLFQAGLFSLHPPGPIAPGGIDRSAGWQLYWQREPGLYGNWLPTFSQGVYYVLSPLQGLALLLLSTATCLTGAAWRVAPGRSA